MLILVAAALAASPSPRALARPAGATVQATASIRIISGASVRWAEMSDDLPKIRVTKLRGGSEPQPLRLVEFQ